MLTPADIALRLEDIKTKLKTHLGITLGSKLGDSGRYGVAFQISPDKALKITVDKKESLNNVRMQKLHLKHFVEVYRVFQFKSLPDIYFSILEKLNPLSDDQKYALKAVPNAIAVFNSEYDKMLKLGELSLADNSEAKEKSFAQIRSIQKQLTPLAKGFLVFEVLTPNYNWSMVAVTKVPNFINQLTEAFQEFKQRGFKNLDIHSQNMGISDNGTLKFFDFGHKSQVPGSGRIETLKAAYPYP